MLTVGKAQIGFQEELLCCRERWEWPAGLRPGKAPSGHRGKGLLLLCSPGELPKCAPQCCTGCSCREGGVGAFLTSLDHLSQVRLSKNLGHPEHHQGILGADQVCAESSVQKADKELCVEQQVLLDKRLPVKKQSAESMVSSSSSEAPRTISSSKSRLHRCGSSWRYREDRALEQLSRARRRKTVALQVHFHGPQCPHGSSNSQGWREGKHPNSPPPPCSCCDSKTAQPHPLLPPAALNELTQAAAGGPALHAPSLPSLPYAGGKGRSAGAPRAPAQDAPFL